MGSKLSTKRERRQWSRNQDRRSNGRLENHRNLRVSNSEEGCTRTTEEEKCYDPRDPTLIFVDREDELDFLCNDYKSLRALMSCGHAVTPMSLTDWCHWQLDEGESKFVCGQTGCDVEWPFDEVCKMALLTPEEIEDFEKKVFNNAAKDFFDVKACPGCKSLVMRADPYDLSVKCTVCTAERNKTYRFCWQCLREWKGPAPRSDRCENEDCQNPLELLWTCPDIDFEDVRGVTGCPCIRACPTCGLVVEHNRAQCKNITCRRCKVEFCFVCLKLTEDCLGLPEECNELDLITSFYEPCSSGVAPRQTSLPVWQRQQ
ncbi:hypothetical protein L3Q82_016832 [Scortum barcoo]|uniref:Uncharacterized protein n=1 Tax=Scortum barcoo TaxID=214431 RepID=A0ACB8X9F0_9TELE|nr:hypothetical protein L3Q82_016832 [Scortum barcoo]